MIDLGRESVQRGNSGALGFEQQIENLLERLIHAANPSVLLFDPPDRLSNARNDQR